MYRDQDSWQKQLVFTLGLLAVVVLVIALFPEPLERWQAILPYLVDTNSQPVLAPVEGKVDMTLDTLRLISEASGEVLADWPRTHFEQILVEQGAYVLSGNALGFHDTWAFGALSQGLGLTLLITGVAFACAVLLGGIVGCMLVSSTFITRGVASAFVAFVYGIPLLIHIFLIYYVLSEIFLFDRLVSALVALSIYNAAYIAEMVRKALLALPAGQMVAAKSLGVKSWQAIYYIFLPQVAWRLLLPLMDQLMRLFKHSSLVSVIAIMDLTKSGQDVINVTLYPLEVWVTVALLYLLVSRLMLISARYLATVMPTYAVQHAGSLGHMKIQAKSLEVKSFNIEGTD